MPPCAGIRLLPAGGHRVSGRMPRRAGRCARCTIAAIELIGLPPRRLGGGGLLTSRIMLGTMLFGEGTSPAEAHELMNLAEDAGISALDTSEMYPVPQCAATQGASERIVGEWLAAGGSSRRGRMLVATKVAGPSAQMPWIRGGPLALDAAAVTSAVEGSLARLRCDCIDLLQLHWPDRYVPMFGDVDFDPTLDYAQSASHQSVMEAVGRAIAAGKVRGFGLSNETAWGVLKCTSLARDHPGECPRVDSLQNSYSLVSRSFDATLAESCHREGVPLLAYSPLAMGLLSAKYEAPGGGPPTARMNRYRGRYAEGEARYSPAAKSNLRPAVREYAAIAAAWGMTPAAMALRFVVRHTLVAAAVVGVTTTDQLAELVRAAAAEHREPMDPELVAAVDAVHVRYPNPAP